LLEEREEREREGGSGDEIWEGEEEGIRVSQLASHVEKTETRLYLPFASHVRSA